MTRHRYLFAPMLVSLAFAAGATACGSDDKASPPSAAPTTTAVAATTTAAASASSASDPASASSVSGSASSTGGSGESIKIGFITKFPVDFYDTMVDAAKKWDDAHDDA